MHIKNPMEWFFAQFDAATEIGSVQPADYFATAAETAAAHGAPVIRRIKRRDLSLALRAGVADFAAARTDVIFLCLIYPVAGLIIAALDGQHALLPLLFPTASGFALVGPLFAIGLYEMSRQRERTGSINYLDVFNVIRSPQIGPIALMAVIIIGLFLLWLAVAQTIFDATLGPTPPVSVLDFATAIITTPAGWAMILLGTATGAIFATGVLAISVVTFPLLLDRHVTLATAIKTSLMAVRRNPVVLAQWGLIITAGLFLGSLPCFLGLVLVLPILGHGTWHLYKRLVKPLRPG
jgi:uncharacterized membrane protein